MRQTCIDTLNRRGVTIQDIVECVVYLQKPYVETINEKHVEEVIYSILDKREVQHALLTGIAIDEAVEQKNFGDKALEEVIAKDFGLYGIDEVLAYGICNLYGSIALTNYGYIDKVKPGIIGKLNEPHDLVCSTFLDDIVGAIAAAAASKLAHSMEEAK